MHTIIQPRQRRRKSRLMRWLGALAVLATIALIIGVVVANHRAKTFARAKVMLLAKSGLSLPADARVVSYADEWPRTGSTDEFARWELRSRSAFMLPSEDGDSRSRPDLWTLESAKPSFRTGDYLRYVGTVERTYSAKWHVGHLEYWAMGIDGSKGHVVAITQHRRQ
ncbi:MAG: hypothetical protein AB7G17_06105 [Phycisphaerales bacterium]